MAAAVAGFNPKSVASFHHQKPLDPFNQLSIVEFSMGGEQHAARSDRPGRWMALTSSKADWSVHASVNCHC